MVLVTKKESFSSSSRFQFDFDARKVYQTMLKLDEFMLSKYLPK